MKKSWDIIAMIFFAAAANIVADIVRRPELTRTVWDAATASTTPLFKQLSTSLYVNSLRVPISFS